MALIEVSKMVIPTGDENGVLKYLIGIKLGDRDPALVCNNGQFLVFDTVEEAQNYIDEEDNF